MPELKRIKTPNAGFYTDVLLCCAPLLVMSYVLYGPRPVILCGISCAMAYVCDRLLAPLHGPDYDQGELSSECFAVLLTLLMPANVSAYVLAFAVLTAVVVKEVFGGCGNYPFNPTAVAYAVVAVGWPEEIFRYPAVGQIPITGTGSLTLFESASATLQAGGTPNLSDMQLLVGNYAGPLGTGFTLILIACGTFLLHRKRIPLATVLSFLSACVLVAWCFPRMGDLPLSAPWHQVPMRLASLKFEVLSGAMIFAAVFLICEPVTQPKNLRSRVNYGFFLGLLSMMFRYYGAYETGVCFAVLILNALSDRLDRVLDSSASLVFQLGHKAADLPAVRELAASGQASISSLAAKAAPKKSDGPLPSASKAAVPSGNTGLLDTQAALDLVNATLVNDAEDIQPEERHPAAARRSRRVREDTNHTLMIPALKDIPVKEDDPYGGK